MRVIVLALFLLLDWTTSIHAAPVVLVKARTVIEVDGLFPSPEGGMVLVGHLKEKDLPHGIPGRLIEVTVTGDDDQPHHFRVRTDDQGRFQVELPSSEQPRFQVSARFLGDPTYASTNPSAQTLDITKKTPKIRLSAPEEVELAQRRLQLTIQSGIGEVDEPAGLPLSLHATSSGEQIDLGRVTTDRQGKAEILIPLARFRGPGQVTLMARFAGDARLNPAEGQVETLVMSEVKLVLRCTSQTIRADDDVRLTGQLSDASGGIASATVSLEAMDRHVSSTLTGSDGRFTFLLAAKDYPPGQLDLVAHFTPDEIWRHPGRSNSVQIMILPPKPIPVRLYAIPVAVTTMIMIGLLLVRLWPALRRRIRMDARTQQKDKQLLEPVQSGARLSRTSLRSLIKQAHDVHGQIWDPVDKLPISGAKICIEPPGPNQPRMELFSDASGRFQIPGLPTGTHTFTVSKQGYVSETFRAQIPHRGNLHGIRVDLVQVRVRLLELYREVALPLLPERELWGCWTPRQLTRHVGSRAGRRDWHLEQLTGILEQSYWAGEPMGEEVLGKARDLVSHLS